VQIPYGKYYDVENLPKWGQPQALEVRAWAQKVSAKAHDAQPTFTWFDAENEYGGCRNEIFLTRKAWALHCDRTNNAWQLLKELQHYYERPAREFSELQWEDEHRYKTLKVAEKMATVLWGELKKEVAKGVLQIDAVTGRCNRNN
jgi:hypothetical protein